MNCIFYVNELVG